MLNSGWEGFYYRQGKSMNISASVEKERDQFILRRMVLCSVTAIFGGLQRDWVTFSQLMGGDESPGLPLR